MQLKGAVWNALGSLMWGMQSFIMLTVVSRVAPLEQIGCFGIAFTTAQILYIVGQFGVTHYQMTDYAEKYPFAAYFRSRILSVLVTAALCGAVILCMRFTGEKALYTVALTVMMLVHVFGELYHNLFFQKNRLDLSGSSQFVRTLVSLLLFCGVLYATHNIFYAVCAQTASNLAVVVLYAKVVAKPFLVGQKPCGAGDVRSLVGECFPLFGSMLLMNVIINASKYGVEWFMDDTAQGYFNMVFMPAQVINLCSQFIFKPYLRQYADALEQHDPSRLRRLMLRQVALIAGMTVAACTGAYFLGTPVLGLVYNKDISAYVLPLVWIVLGGGLFAVCQLLYYILVLCRRQKQILFLYVGGIASSAALSVLLVRQFGLRGAAWAFAAAHLLLVCGFVLLVHKYAVKAIGDGRADQ